MHSLHYGKPVLWLTTHYSSAHLELNNSKPMGWLKVAHLPNDSHVKQPRQFKAHHVTDDHAILMKGVCVSICECVCVWWAQYFHVMRLIIRWRAEPRPRMSRQSQHEITRTEGGKQQRAESALGCFWTQVTAIIPPFNQSPPSVRGNPTSSEKSEPTAEEISGFNKSSVKFQHYP